LVGAADGEPALPGEMDVASAARAADAVERDDLLTNEAAVDPGRQVAGSAVVLEGGVDSRPHEQDAEDGDRDGGQRLQQEGVGEGEGDDGGGEAAGGDEDGVEGEVMQLDAEEHHSGDHPRNG